MSADTVARTSIVLVPVLVFLAVLRYYDSFKLVGLRSVLVAILVGGAAAGASYAANLAVLGRLDVDFVAYTRYVSPWIEEVLKGLVLGYLVGTRRIGTLVDAAIFGFAIGTGFALVENLYYLLSRPDARVAVQVIRGFGTAQNDPSLEASVAFVLTVSTWPVRAWACPTSPISNAQPDGPPH